MKKILLCLIFGVLLIGMFSFVSAKHYIGVNATNGDGNQLGQDDDNKIENEIECGELSQEDCEANAKCGYYADEEGDSEGWCKKIQDMSNKEAKEWKEQKSLEYAFGYRFKLEDSNMTKEEFKAMIRKKFGNKTEEGEEGEIRVQLSNGRKANIKIMPNVASETALQRLRLKNCNVSNNCSIELKEVGKGEGNKTRAAYEIQIQRHEKLLGMFRIKAQHRVQVDAETGEVIKVGKPWWSFLAVDIEE